ncbi:hypothetical protein, partial [Paenibacillus odorifer]|uniref:hypothetical protein n=1 Tax=Paenibacillus odorifer TaxID=189426 RepID=UPI001C4D25F6
ISYSTHSTSAITHHVFFTAQLSLLTTQPNGVEQLAQHTVYWLRQESAVQPFTKKKKLPHK